MKLNKYIWIRKTIHLLCAILPLSYYYFFSKHQFLIITLSLTIIAFLIELLRFKNQKFGSRFHKLLGNLLWKEESETLTGATTFLIATFISTILFPRPVVLTVLLFLTFGDTIAYLVGNTLGKIRIFGKKTLEGALALLFASIIIVLLIPEINFWQGLAGAITACIVELLPWRIDDNLSIPLISGSILHLLTI